MKLGLENIQILLAVLENPHKKFFKVQIAGTNGKGSVCAFLEAICTAAGIRVGVFTSPHLVSIIERIKINGVEISEEDFARHATRIRETCEKLLDGKTLAGLPTFFEHTTAIALSYFAEQKIELAILETGLGGRLDAVTGADAEVIGITQIDFDHQKYLGNTLREIASEKAATIRFPNQKVFVSKQHEEVESVIRDRCEEFGIVMSVSRPRVSKGARINAETQRHGDVEIVSFKTEKSNYQNVSLALRGKHQIENAQLAIMIAESLGENFKITRENIVEGLQTAKHPGRLEYCNGILFDGAHNIAGARALREYLADSISQPITLIFGAMRDKDSREIAEILFPIADKIILTRINNERAASPAELREFALGESFEADNARDALEIASRFADNLTVVTGSLYLVGEARKIVNS